MKYLALLAMLIATPALAAGDFAPPEYAAARRTDFVQWDYPPEYYGEQYQWDAPQEYWQSPAPYEYEWGVPDQGYGGYDMDGGYHGGNCDWLRQYNPDAYFTVCDP